MPPSKPVTWQPINQVPLIADLITGAREDADELP